MARGLVLALLLPLMAVAEGSAQVPLGLRTTAHEAFEIITYDNSQHDIQYSSGTYFLVFQNEGPLDTEYWVRNSDGEVVEHGFFCCDGGTQLELERDDRYRFQFNGQGRFAVTHPNPLDNLHVPIESFSLEAQDNRVGFSVSKDAATAHVCIEGDQDFRMSAFTAGLSPITASQSVNKTLYYSFEPQGFFENIFLVGASTYNVTVANVDCRTLGFEPALNEESPSIGVGGLVILLILPLVRRR